MEETQNSPKQEMLRMVAAAIERLTKLKEKLEMLNLKTDQSIERFSAIEDLLERQKRLLQSLEDEVEE